MNVFHGTMKDNVVKGKWADLPLSASGGAGTVKIEYDAEKDILFLNKETGSLIARKWIRVGAAGCSYRCFSEDPFFLYGESFDASSGGSPLSAR